MRRSKLLLAWLLLLIFPLKIKCNQIYDYFEEYDNYETTEDYQNVDELEETTGPESKPVL